MEIWSRAASAEEGQMVLKGLSWKVLVHFHIKGDQKLRIYVIYAPRD